MSRDLIVFGEDWGGLPSSTQHLVRHLARDRRTVWVNSIGLRRPRFSRCDVGRAFRKASESLARRSGISRPAPFPVLAPRAIPLPGNPIATAFNRRVLSAQVKRSAAAAGLRNPTLWVSLPTALSVVGRLGERAVVYYCGDDFGALAGVDHGPVLRMERELVQQADLVLAASDALARRFPQEKTVVVPHGVDLEQFTTPAPRAKELSGEAPVAGFYGSIADWVDIDLLAGVAARLPSWRFLLIGEIKTDISKLRYLHNVEMLGPRPHRELATFSQHWNASMLPFRDNAQIRACNPLKLREYLAAGKAVVSTDFPALEGYRDVISVARDTDDFVDRLRGCLQESPAASEARRRRVSKEGWDARAAAVAPLLDQLT